MYHDVYICYSSKDSEIANRVCEALEKSNIKCWIAPRNVEVGKDFSSQIKEAIESSKIVVLISSRNAYESHFVKEEIKYGDNIDKSIFVVNTDGCLPPDDFELSFRNVAGISDYDQQDSLKHLANSIEHMFTEGIYKPDAYTTGIDKSKAIFSNKNNKFGPSFIYLSYDNADLEFIESQIQQFKFMDVNFMHQIGSKIKDSALLVVFISKDSCSSSKIKDDIKKAVSGDIDILLIHLDDCEPDFGRMFNLKYGSKFEKAVKYSIYKSELDELAYIDKFDEIFQMFGVKK